MQRRKASRRVSSFVFCVTITQSTPRARSFSYSAPTSSVLGTLTMLLGIGSEAAISAAVVYLVATVSLAKAGRTWFKVSLAAVLVELVGVIVVGALSVFDPVAFPHETVWSLFGRGYAFIPLLLPILGLVWLYRRRPGQRPASVQA